MTTRCKTASKRREAAARPDVTAILTKPVTVGRHGREQRMTPYEVMLRALVKKALKEHSLNAIRSLVETALKYDLVVPPPPPPKVGGVRVWPRLLALDVGDVVGAGAAEAAPPEPSTAGASKKEASHGR